MSGKVLIVDDAAMVHESLRDLLERRGLSPVGAAGDGNEAVSMASSLEPDVIVMDRMMPGMDGVEATRRIKSDPAADPGHPAVGAARRRGPGGG